MEDTYLVNSPKQDPYPVNSPRRVLSLSRKRSSFLDVNDKPSGFGLSGQHGPKPAEVYGFVGSITTVVATGAVCHPCFVAFTTACLQFL